MNILIVSMSHYFGGAEAYILNIEKVLSKKYNVYILTSSPIIRDRSTSNIIFLKRTPFIHLLKTILVLIYSNYKYSFSFVFLNGARETLLSNFLTRKIKTIGISHTEIFPLKNIIALVKSHIKLFFFRRVGNIICVSNHVYNQFKSLSDKGLYDFNSIFLIPNWPHTQYKNLQYRPFDDNYLHILVVAKLTESKGHKELFEACKGIPNLVFHIVGSGPLEKKLFNISKGLSIIFHGHHSDVSSFYQKCHLLILPSKWEGGNPLCLLEGMAVGIDCIGNNIPPIAEILEKNSLFDVSDFKSVRELILNKKNSKKYLNKKNIYLPNNNYLDLLDCINNYNTKKFKSLEIRKNKKFTYEIDKEETNLSCSIIIKIDTFDDLERHFSNKCYFSDLKKHNIEFILLFDNKNLKEDCKDILSNFGTNFHQILLNKDLNKIINLLDTFPEDQYVTFYNLESETSLEQLLKYFLNISLINPDLLLIKNKQTKKITKSKIDYIHIKKISDAKQIFSIFGISNILIRRSFFKKYFSISDILNKNYENIFLKMFLDKKLIYKLFHYSDLNKNIHFKSFENNVYNSSLKENEIKKIKNRHQYNKIIITFFKNILIIYKLFSEFLRLQIFQYYKTLFKIFL